MADVLRPEESALGTIEIRHADEAVAKRVRAWFERRQDGRRLAALDGSRSVLLPHPHRRDAALKIKGAGFLGGPVLFGQHPSTGPSSAQFDFEGRYMEDVASGHDHASIGSASFQQAATEYETTKLVQSLGYAAVPCLGYGRFGTGDRISWFSIFEWDRSWQSMSVSESLPLEAYLDANIRLSELLLELAVQHGLVGYFALVRGSDHNWMLKDLHPFHRLNPVSHSQLSWVMQVLRALHIRCSAVRHFSLAAGATMAPTALAAYPLRALVPDASAADFEAFRAEISRPYLRQPPVSFTPEGLVAALRRTRVGSAALELCPDEYTRW